MPNTLIHLLNEVTNAKEALAETERVRDAFIRPILIALGIDCATRSGITIAYVDADTLHIELSGSTRGCSWSRDYEFPKSIFTSQDPIAAAKAYVAEKARLEKLQEVAAKKAKLNELTKELLEMQAE